VPIFPRTDAAFAAGSAVCAASFDVAADGALSNIAVTGCAEPLSEPLRLALMVSKTTTKFAGKHPHVDLAVPFDKPALELAPVRRTIGDEPVVHIPLERAVRVEQAWAKYYDKKPFASRDGKGGICTVELYVTGEGNVYAVDMERCNEALVFPVSMAVFEWKFTPEPRPDGTNGPVRFDQTVVVAK
jgi:hypothetical protein